MALLKVRAVGTALVTDHDAMDNGVRRFIGRKLDAAAGAFVPVDSDVEVSARAEHVGAVRDGDLEPADAATASLCGVSFSKSAPKKEA